jgi:thiosulfate dehydrogenase [quinone] large subunit
MIDSENPPATAGFLVLDAAKALAETRGLFAFCAGSFFRSRMLSYVNTARGRARHSSRQLRSHRAVAPEGHARGVHAQRSRVMPQTAFDRFILVFFRLAMGWTFLYAASHQVFDPKFSVAGFLGGTKTFHDVYAIFATPDWAPLITALVSYGHLLIGLSLLVGLMVRVSAAFGILLMLMYWTAHMDFPYIENANNFLLDYHIVYAGVLAFLIAKRAGHVLGLDGCLERHGIIERYPLLRPLLA